MRKPNNIWSRRENFDILENSEIFGNPTRSDLVSYSDYRVVDIFGFSHTSINIILVIISSR